MKGQGGNATLPQSPYKKRRLKPYHIKYYGLIAVFLMMISAVKVFVNYATIQSSITRVVAESENISRHKQYAALQAFAYTIPEAAQFIAHDNSLLLKGEQIFQFTVSDTTGDTVISTGLVQTITGTTSIDSDITPRQSWMNYFAKKIEG